jgi:hypothetical protein
MSLELEFTESGNPIDIPAGVYGGTIAAVEEADGQFYKGGQVKFTVELDGQTKDDGSPLDMWAWANAKFSTKSKLTRWVKALGQKPVIGQTFHMQQLTGLRCGVLVEREESKEGVRCRIAEILPPTNGSKPQATAHPMEEPAEDRCVECFAPLAYFGADGKAFCSEHGPLAGKVAS